jgi:hypothetical protein
MWTASCGGQVFYEGSAAMRVRITLCGPLFRGAGVVSSGRFDETAKASTAIGCKIDDHGAEQENRAEAGQQE